MVEEKVLRVPLILAVIFLAGLMMFAAYANSSAASHIYSLCGALSVLLITSSFVVWAYSIYAVAASKTGRLSRRRGLALYCVVLTMATLLVSCAIVFQWPGARGSEAEIFPRILIYVWDFLMLFSVVGSISLAWIAAAAFRDSIGADRGATFPLFLAVMYPFPGAFFLRTRLHRLTRDER
jgi:hypothetical protein